MNSAISCIYAGEVVHQRIKPRRHRLRYAVFSLLVDLDELSSLCSQLRLLSYNRANLFSFHDKDHGPKDGSPLRPWVEHQLLRLGIDLAGGPIRLLCYPRILGYVFNPLSVYFCYVPQGRLTAILYEVHNTFGQCHSYLIPVPSDAGATIEQECRKLFYVSPFIPMDMIYRFRVRPPSDEVRLVINERDAQGPVLFASFQGSRVMLTDRSLWLCFFRYPLMTLKIMAGIHWEAIRLWWKGVPIVQRPDPPREPVTPVVSEG